MLWRAAAEAWRRAAALATRRWKQEAAGDVLQAPPARAARPAALKAHDGARRRGAPLAALSLARHPLTRSLRARAEALYGGWKSAKLLFAEAPAAGAGGRPRVVGRWDWHAAQALMALGPVGLILALVGFARRDMAREQMKLNAQVDAAAAEKAAAGCLGSVGGAGAAPAPVELAARLAALEAKMEAIGLELRGRPAAAKAAPEAAAAPAAASAARPPDAPPRQDLRRPPPHPNPD
jgi:hypothetical protein